MSERWRLEQGNPPNKWIARIVIALALLNIAAGWLGDLLLSLLVDNQPLALIALSPRDRNLALASPSLAAAPFFLVGFLRLFFFDPFSYLLGFWYGDRALDWIRRRSRTYGPLVDNAQSGFRRYAAPLIILFPNNVICMMAGASGIGVVMFFALNAFGTLGRLFLLRQFGNIFGGEINSVVGWIADYRVPILIVSALAIGWTIFGEFRGDTSEVKALIDLERHPEASDPVDEAPLSDPSGESDQA